jgi:hypothetical protein
MADSTALILLDEAESLLEFFSSRQRSTIRQGQSACFRSKLVHIRRLADFGGLEGSSDERTQGMLSNGPSPEPRALERALMKRDGYLVARSFFDAEQIGKIAQWTAELAAAPEISGRHWVYHEASVTQPERRVIQRIENFCPFHEGFSTLIEHGALRGGPALSWAVRSCCSRTRSISRCREGPAFSLTRINRRVGANMHRSS